jgi:hypothetical protein
MSGGAFDYQQRLIPDIIERIEEEISLNGKIKTEEELKEESWRGGDWYEKYPEDLKYYEYPEDIIAHFKDGIKYLRLAYIYAQRIDWLLSGDDGEDSFRKRLKEEIEKLNKDGETTSI